MVYEVVEATNRFVRIANTDKLYFSALEAFVNKTIVKPLERGIREGPGLTPSLPIGLMQRLQVRPNAGRRVQITRKLQPGNSI